MPKLIDTLNLPGDLRRCSVKDLERVSAELREELIDSVASSGGHFASSLGAAEISVVLHHLFNTPQDRIVWDVGHQGYVHKMLTGRRDRLGSIRQKGGISGFLKRSESEYDAFGAGHAGTSISAGVGMSAAFQKSDPSRYVVAVIGDGSLTSGMAFEALNHAGDLGLKNFIVLLNDNEMSISENVGALSRLFSMTLTSKASTLARGGFKKLYQSGFVPDFIYKTIDRWEETTQGFLAPAAMLFESFGFRYIGPVDGHNIGALKAALEHAKTQDVPVVVHARTQKGRGYEPAEGDPIKWHGVNPFDRDKGEFVSKAPAAKAPPSYTEVFAKTMIEIADSDGRLAAVTAAMPTGTGLDKFSSAHPDKFYDVGICEQHAVTFAAGLACEGRRPVCAIYSTFLQRAFDQVVHDVCVQNLPVVFAMDRGGVVGNDGETHQGVFDISYLRAIPHITIMSPKDEAELRQMIYTSINHDGPCAIRYPRGSGLGASLEGPLVGVEIGKSEIIQRGDDVLLIAFGPMVGTALNAASKIAESGFSTTVVNARFAKPLDKELLSREIARHTLTATIEDHALQGGFGSAVLEMIQDAGLKPALPIARFGVGDAFVAHASQTEQHQEHGYDAKNIYEKIVETLRASGAAPRLAMAV